MTDRYLAEIVEVVDHYSVVINKGRNDGIGEKQKYLVVGLGKTIIDPKTNEELEKLEILRGKVSAEHIQSKISTLKSCEYEITPDTKKIKKTSTRSSLSVFGPENIETETITPGDKSLKPLKGAQVGDFIMLA